MTLILSIISLSKIMWKMCIRDSHMGDHDRFNFDWKWLPESGLSVKDFIAPTGFAFPKNRIFQMGGMYGSCLLYTSRCV